MINHNLFSTPVAIFDVPNFEEINKDIMPLTVNNQWGFKEFKELWSLREEIPGLKRLYYYFMHFAATYTNTNWGSDYKAMDFSHKHGWLNTAHPGEYQRPHDHGGISIAITYYVQVDDNTGEINLYDPRGNRGWMGPQMGQFDNDRQARSIFQHQPKVGQAIIFPGWLLHSTELNKSNLTRVSVTSNINLVEKFV